MNRFPPSAPRLEDFGPKGLKEERDLRHAFGIITWTAAVLLGSLIGTAAADDGVGAPASSRRPRDKTAGGGGNGRSAGCQQRQRGHQEAALRGRPDRLGPRRSRGGTRRPGSSQGGGRPKDSVRLSFPGRPRDAGAGPDRPAASPEECRDVRRGRTARRPRTVPRGPRLAGRFSSAAPDAAPTRIAAAAPVPSARQQAKRLLAQARAAFNAGDFDEARSKALKADEFDVKWDILEDQPQTLLSEIERATGTKILSRKTAQEADRRERDGSAPHPGTQFDPRRDEPICRRAGSTPPGKRRSRPNQLNVVFGMFEDRPDTLLADVARAERSSPANSDDLFAFGNEPDNTAARSPKETQARPRTRRKHKTSCGRPEST